MRSRHILQPGQLTWSPFPGRPEYVDEQALHRARRHIGEQPVAQAQGQEVAECDRLKVGTQEIDVPAMNVRLAGMQQREEFPDEPGQRFAALARKLSLAMTHCPVSIVASLASRSATNLSRTAICCSRLSSVALSIAILGSVALTGSSMWARWRRSRVECSAFNVACSTSNCVKLALSSACRSMRE